MRVRLYGGKSSSNKDMKQIEKHFSCCLPMEYKEFVTAFNGSKIGLNIFDVDKNEQGAVSQFVPIGKVLYVQSITEGVPDRVVPIAWAECGNLVVLNVDDGRIYYWNHEFSENLTHLADTFNEFLNSICPLSLDDVDVRPEQIKRVWVDPDFFDKHKGGK